MNSALGVKMKTKESLKADATRINQAVFELRKSYSNSPDAKILYIIIEGKEDICFYKSILTHRIKEQGWETKFLKAKNREKAVEAYSLIDWQKYNKNQILIIIDRDLSSFTNEYTPNDKNVYVTDNYSIENDLFSKECCENTLRIFFGLEDLKDDEMRIILDLFVEGLKEFQKKMFEIMSWILCWRIKGEKCNLDNIRINKLFSFDQGVLNTKVTYNKECVEYIHRVCNVPYHEIDISRYKRLFQNKDGLNKFIRGKYIKSFFVMFINSIHNCCGKLLPSKQCTKTHITLGDNNALPILSGIIRAPQSFLNFFEITANVFISERENIIA